MHRGVESLEGESKIQLLLQNLKKK
uniref:Uncharacterized protein n=1 Tax=Rhizophora mucronata TaxID=61149 RepID=A0A2P2II50_RHIMU